MRRLITLLLIAVAVMTVTDTAMAQRRINPVKQPSPTQLRKAKKPSGPDKSRLAERLDAQGNIVLVDTVTELEYVDTTAVAGHVVGNIYPLLHGVTIGLDIWDPVMRLIGQDYGGASAWATVNLHNRFFPRFEMGLSQADITPDGMNFTFKSPMAPFFKIGCGYNIFYNSNPDYQLIFGANYGFTPFSYTIENVKLLSDYWPGETDLTFPKTSTTAGYFELTAGIKVRIVKNISLGWTFKYHTVIHEGRSTVGKPIYIPGFGKRGNPITGAFSVMYTLPLNKAVLPKVDKED